MVSKKRRRHSGYVTPNSTISKKEIIKEDHYINPYYNDWLNYRDGYRDWIRDYKKIKKLDFLNISRFQEEIIIKLIAMNNKQKKLLKRRKAMKLMRK